MAQINKYSDNAAYVADTTRLSVKSAVSMLSDSQKIVYDGVNVITQLSSAAQGDVVVYDTVSSTLKILKAGTILKAQLPTTLIPTAVVYAVLGRKVLVMSIPDAASAPWAHSYDCLISNVNLTTFLANGGTITINTKSGANTITVPAGSTVAGVVALINANTTIRSDAWTAKAGTNGIIMSLNTWDETLMTLTVDGADWVVTRQAINYQTTLSGILGAATTNQIRRVNGCNSYFAGANNSKFLSFCSSNGTVPTSNIPIGSSTIVDKSSFETSDYCASLRAKYSSYADYLYGEHNARYPINYGYMSSDSGLANTITLSSNAFTGVDGTVENAYPAAKNATSFASAGMAAGSWWLPSVKEMFLMIKDAALELTDKVNKSLSALGGSPISTSGYYWCSDEYDSDEAVFYGGYYGGLSSNSKNGVLSVRPVSALYF